MSFQKRMAMIFLSAINIMTVAAGVITQLQLALGKDVTSIIPIKTEMTVCQILLLNFTIVVAIMLLISIVTTYLATDIPYSPKEILANCAGIFMIIPVIVFLAAVYNAVKAPVTADKLWLILSGLFYVAANAVNFGCILTVKSDSEN